MLAFLGLRVHHPLTNKNKYRQALQQIRHYLSCKHKIEIQQNQFIMGLRHEQCELSLVKNQNYLHTNYYNLPLFSSEDWEMLETYYECLMILRETFPAALAIQLVTEEESKEITDFVAQKEEEFNRRINSNLKTIAQQSNPLDSQEIEQLIYLTVNHYVRKNKVLGLKILLSKVQQSNISNLGQEYLEMLNNLQEAQHKKIVSDINKKLKTLQFALNRNKENTMNNNQQTNTNSEPIKLNALLFQLKESHNIQRVCSLLHIVLTQHQNSELLGKIQKAVNVVTNRFIEDEYEEGPIYAGEFSDCIKTYWQRRGKKIEQDVLKALQLKQRQVSEHNRSKLISSCKL